MNPTKDRNIVIERTAKRLGIPVYEVRKAVNSYFGFMLDVIEEGKFEGFYMRYLGRFVVKPKRLDTMQAKLKEKMSRELNSFEDPTNIE